MKKGKLLFLKKTDSTNRFAKEHRFLFTAKALHCITTYEQTAGYGREKRPWNFIKGKDLAITFYFRLDSTRALSALSHIAALALLETLKSKKIAAKIKWPNDIIFEDQKLAGILTEVDTQKETTEIFLGLGLNINSDAKELLAIDQKATSLKEIAQHNFNRNKILKKLISSLAKKLKIFIKEGFKPFIREFEKNLNCMGHKIDEGLVIGLSSEGELLIKTEKGQIKKLRGPLTHTSLSS